MTRGKTSTDAVVSRRAAICGPDGIAGVTPEVDPQRMRGMDDLFDYRDPQRSMIARWAEAPRASTGSGVRTAATLLLIRHADVDPAGRMYGAFDAPLSATGRAALEALRDRPPTRAAPAALYTSPLTRAREVAALLGRTWRLEPRYATGLGDIHYGRVEGMRIEDLRRVYAATWARHEAQVDDHFRWPDGESYYAFRARVLGCLSSIAAKHAGERVAIVTHAGVVSQVLGTVKARPPSAWQADWPDPLSGTELTWNGVGPCDLLCYNDAAWL